MWVRGRHLEERQFYIDLVWKCGFGMLLGFATLMLFAINFMIVPGMLACISFLMLFNVCSAVTVECCVLYPCCVGVFGICAII